MRASSSRIYLPRSLEHLKIYETIFTAKKSVWFFMTFFFHLPQSGVFSYKMHRGAFATRHSLTCDFLYAHTRVKYPLILLGPIFAAIKAGDVKARIRILYLAEMCTNTLRRGALNAVSTWNGAAHFSGEVSRWTYPSGKTIVASPETDGFRLYLEDQVDEPRLWSCRASCENLLSWACSFPQICWTKIWNANRFLFTRGENDFTVASKI